MSNKAYLETDICILGAGASGLFCASLLGPNARTIILEKNPTAGKKILISGGGKCNFTNLNISREDYVSDNKNFHVSALKRYPSSEFIKLVQSYKIDYYEKELGQLFCKKSAKSVLGMLLNECNKKNVTQKYHQTIESVEYKNDLFEITTNDSIIKATHCIVATGGCSFPKIGATSFGYQLAKQFGHSIIPTSAALVGLNLDGYSELAGISTECEVKIKSKKISGPVLFSHRGLTGPAILKASLYWSPGQNLMINWLPQLDLREELNRVPTHSTLENLLRKKLPARMVDFFLDRNGIEKNTPLNQVARKKLNKLVDDLNYFRFGPTKNGGYDRAEVTRGGVNTKEVCPNSMQSKLVKNLYFIGEVLDVTGQLGGFNFQWAWASAYAASNHIKTDYR
ncbi:MAG: NAD(P)/FAD-dependent oxidoreductase [Bacteriovoracaceae bacterium]